MGDERLIRLACFLGFFLLLAVLEYISPRRPRTVSKRQRWLCNIAVVGVDNILVRLLLPVVPTGMAAIAAQNHWGLLNQVQLPRWASILIAFVVLDLTIYLQH